MEHDGADWLERTRILLGSRALDRLRNASVCVFGLGAVGSYAVEGMARAGVGSLCLVDFDVMRESNLNRQLYALRSTLGRPKAEVAADRVRDINPLARVRAEIVFAHHDTLPGLLARPPDLVVDAVDSLGPKVEILAAAGGLGLPVFSAMGAATRTDADAVRFGPLFGVRGCPLGRLVRKRLRRRGVEGDFWCVYSDEPRNRDAVREAEADEAYPRGRARSVLGSMSTLTGLFGLRLAHEAVLRLSGFSGAEGEPG